MYECFKLGFLQIKVIQLKISIAEIVHSGHNVIADRFLGSGQIPVNLS